MNKARISINKIMLNDSRKIIISLEDELSNIEFVNIYIDLDKFSDCLTGLSYIECEIKTKNLEYVGKKVERKILEFPLSEQKYLMQKDTALKELPKHVPEGFVAEKSFSSKDSFFYKNDILYARTYIKKWVKQ